MCLRISISYLSDLFVATCRPIAFLTGEIGWTASITALVQVSAFVGFFQRLQFYCRWDVPQSTAERMGTLTRTSISHGFWKAACGRDGECVDTAVRLRLVVSYDEKLGLFMHETGANEAPFSTIAKRFEQTVNFAGLPVSAVNDILHLAVSPRVPFTWAIEQIRLQQGPPDLVPACRLTPELSAKL